MRILRLKDPSETKELENYLYEIQESFKLLPEYITFTVCIPDKKVPIRSISIEGSYWIFRNMHQMEKNVLFSLA